MKFFNLGKRHINAVLTAVLLVVMLGTIAGCEDYGFPSPAPAEKAETETSPTVIRTKDSATLAVYQHLLEQAKSIEAKLYLADFYTTCDNWSVEGEYFKDGSGMWYVLVDMTNVQVWEARLHWQVASWFVSKDGEVIPSNLLNANALRIEADLMELSPESEP